ncbi:acyl-CoA dehydrogenase [Brevundimonas sp. 2R-24]|uniref:Acyl-CoA dehydrogenase n=1 Tax=Peiella sedimenti TaxID=3061083 RepID=A0ABT8SIK1_9CAUL|nr:acyl-CoA dehydrogenase [Caulobacteraceae bacterium XZ-24]
MTFRAPIEDLTFSFLHIAGGERLIETGAWPDLDGDLAAAVIEAAGQTADEVLAALNRTGDQTGARCDGKDVTPAPGFKNAYDRFIEGGWMGLAASTEWGGQGLPKALEQACFETFHAANMAFGLCPMLSLAAIEALETVGSEAQKGVYLPKLVSGEWTGAMVLTEPQAGTDLGQIRTTAEPIGDGRYRLTGQKIFITWGDHDMTPNIVHMVLARLPDAPPGPKGISLFLAPKYLLNSDGSLGERNAFHPVSVEHKLGIHASPTCVMAYEGAEAELVGEPNKGLAHMFVMMNAARLAVGVEGVAIAERALQGAVAYAEDRRQGRSAWSGEADAPILDHPDVRRMLAVGRARIEAARGICLSCAVAGDLARSGPEAERPRWAARQALLTPVAKAWSTDMGVEVASQALQVHGGMGFIEETGAAQHYRDARIAPIYEGTNGVQALDLIGRKLAGDGGEALRDLLAEARADLTGWADPALFAALDAVETGAAWLLEAQGTDRQADALAGAVPFLNLMGDALGGWMLARGVRAAERLGEQVERRRALYEVYARNLLDAAPGRLGAVRQGEAALRSLDRTALAR